ncbi:MAG: glutathione S-transferase [Paucibacter sp.]|nr:glutathione S-transferase [Roseateles sp.]
MHPNPAAQAILITMPHSHYAEKARWALDRLALPYREEPHVPLLHRFATVRRGGRSVPVLVHGAHRLTDSSDILAYADFLHGGGELYPGNAELKREVQALEERFDMELGPHARRWAYAQLLPQRRPLRRVMSRGVPRLEAILMPMILPGVARLIRSALRITPQSAQSSLERVRGLFAEVDERLRDGRAFLIGERFTAADLSFAALAGPVLFPEGGGAAYFTLDEAPQSMREEVLRLRDTEAGRFALRLFSQERRKVLGDSA